MSLNAVNYFVHSVWFWTLQALKKQPTALSSKDKKRLADMAISCYVEQVSTMFILSIFCVHSLSFTAICGDAFPEYPPAVEGGIKVLRVRKI